MCYLTISEILYSVGDTINMLFGSEILITNKCTPLLHIYNVKIYS